MFPFANNLKIIIPYSLWDSSSLPHGHLQLLASLFWLWSEREEKRGRRHTYRTHWCLWKALFLSGPRENRWAGWVPAASAPGLAVLPAEISRFHFCAVVSSTILNYCCQFGLNSFHSIVCTVFICKPALILGLFKSHECKEYKPSLLHGMQLNVLVNIWHPQDVFPSKWVWISLIFQRICQHRGSLFFFE